MAQLQICSSCHKSLSINHFCGKRNHPCTRCAACRGVKPVSLLAVATPAPASDTAVPTSPQQPAILAPLPAPRQPTPATFVHDYSADIDTINARLEAQANFAVNLDTAVSEIRQLVRGIRQDLAPSTSAPAPTDDTVAPPSAMTPRPPLLSGELQIRCLFPWVTPEVAQLVYDNCLLPHDLGKLRKASRSHAEADEDTGVLVGNVRVKPAPSQSKAPDVRKFLRQVPDVCTFAQAWTVYTALRCASASDPNLSASLGSFLIIVMDQDTRYHWPAVAEFVLSLRTTFRLRLRQRLG